MTNHTTLTGFLGHDREVCYTRERTYTQTFRNEIAEMDEEREITIPGRPFLVLSLAVRKGRDRNEKPIWYRLVVWSPERRGLDYIALGREGDWITASGHLGVYTYTGKDGERKSKPQLEVETFNFKRLKIRHAGH